MLLPWSRSTTVALGANGIAVKVDGEEPKTLVKEEKCYKSSSALTEALVQASKQIEAGVVRFIISNHFVRYISIPWHDGLLARQDWVALAEHEFRKSFGKVAENWEVRVSLNNYGKRTVSCAIDQAFIDNLQLISVENKWQISSIEPFLMTALQNITLENQNTWMLLGEPERVVLVQYDQGDWKNFSVVNPPRGMEIEQSEQLLLRELTQVKESNCPKQVLACLAPELKGNLHIDSLNIKSVHIGNKNMLNSALWMVSI
ncbi:MAG TPA: hypothetical protein VLM20_01920 [Methylophilaceae bacterium]|nr:hypothetical protein [Methylophilaceae bacterium]